VRVISDLAPQGSQDRFITLTDVHRLSRMLDEEKIWLRPKDAISTRLWVDHLKSDHVNVFFKFKLD
jgi:hypothetical protein